MAGEPAPTDRLPLRPLLKPWYRRSCDGARTILRYGGSVLEFTGQAAVRLLPQLLPLLDGTRTAADVAARLGEPVRPAIDRALGVLARERLLIEALAVDLPPDAARTVELLAATDRYDRGPAAAQSGLERASAAVVGCSPAARTVGSLLLRSGLGAVSVAAWDDEEAHAADLVVVAPGPDEVVRVREWNRLALERETRWLQVLPFDGLLAAVGPIVVPHESACHECYRLRRSSNLSPLPDDAVGHHPSAPALDAVAAGLAAWVALRHLALGDGLDVGVVLAVEASSELACTRHPIYRVPRCPACSPAAHEAALDPWYPEEADAA